MKAAKTQHTLWLTKVVFCFSYNPDTSQYLSYMPNGGNTTDIAPFTTVPCYFLTGFKCIIPPKSNLLLHREASNLFMDLRQSQVQLRSSLFR